MKLKISDLLSEMEKFTNLGLDGDKTICDLKLEKQFGTLTTRFCYLVKASQNRNDPDRRIRGHERKMDHGKHLLKSIETVYLRLRSLGPAS